MSASFCAKLSRVDGTLFAGGEAVGFKGTVGFCFGDANLSPVVANDRPHVRAEVGWGHSGTLVIRIDDLRELWSINIGGYTPGKRI